MDITADADSTAVTIETLDYLVDVALEDHRDHDKLCAEVEVITEKGMSGRLPFDESLAERIKILVRAGATQEHVDQVRQKVQESITPSFLENASWIRERLAAGKFRFASGGFYDYLQPAFAHVFGAEEHQVLANHFTYDDMGRITGYEHNNPLAQNNGKATLMCLLRDAGVITGHAVILGDGNNDRQARAPGAADEFWHFIENILEKYKDRRLEADAVVYDFDQVRERYNQFGAVALGRTG